MSNQQIRRALIVWLWLAGCRVRDISIRTGTSVSTVYRWLKRWQRAYPSTNIMKETTEASSGYLDLWAHLKLQLWMSAMTTARGQYLDSYQVLKSVLAVPLHYKDPAATYVSCKTGLRVEAQRCKSS